MGEPTSLHAFCRQLLEQGELEAKLEPPRGADGRMLDDADRGAPLHLERPARSADLSLAPGAPPLPRPGELAAPEARARCLARFAHHELMAVELLAWALLRWPSLPSGLRAGLVGVLAEEQVHCRLYLERLAAHGSSLGEHPRSDYFWKHVPAIDASPHGPRAFLAAMGLTLEQANLDFSRVYRDGFRAAGDEASARVCERVHADEIGHVRLAHTWLLQLAPGRSAVDAYEEAVPFPLSAARAKGRHFDAGARRRAGFDEALIEHVRSARSSQERRTGSIPA